MGPEILIAVIVIVMAMVGALAATMGRDTRDSADDDWRMSHQTRAQI